MHISPPFIFLLLFSIAVPASAGMSDSELKGRMIDSYFYTGEGESWQEFKHFKELSAVTDEQLHRVLMDIYREAENKLLALTPDTEEWNYNLGLVDGVIRWLPKCKGIPVKDSLLAYATSEEKHRHTKQTAILSYLRVADAEETRDVLLRFLVGENRMDLGSRSSICRYAQTAFMEADAAKRAAILESLYVALSREENKCNFHVYDDILSELSGDYVHSHQRLAILEKLIDAPPLCKADEFVMPNLTKKLKELQKTQRTTNINTNLSALKERDFNQPSPEEERIALEMPPDALNTTDAAQEKSTETGRKSFYALAAIAGLLGVLALWFGLRRKRGSV
jgi:hypothetical protein